LSGATGAFADLAGGSCGGGAALSELPHEVNATTTSVAGISFSDTVIIMTDASGEPHISRPIIETISLTRTIETPTHRVEILRGIDLTIPRGQFAAIMGPSGSGKSTLLGLLAGLDNATSGQLLLDGEDITGLSEDRMAEVRGRKIGFVFQSFQLIPTLTAEENVLLPAELAGAGPDVTRRAKDLLTRVGLADRLDHYPVQLSGGEQQRVALARAFITKPPILLADEPTGNLDGRTGQQVLELLLELNRHEGATLVLVTHDPALAAHADRIITLRDGLVVSDELVTVEARA
jgi:putative ABC transport system ATP-binding protein